jgi:hypothetical protein
MRRCQSDRCPLAPASSPTGLSGWCVPQPKAADQYEVHARDILLFVERIHWATGERAVATMKLLLGDIPQGGGRQRIAACITPHNPDLVALLEFIPGTAGPLLQSLRDAAGVPNLVSFGELPETGVVRKSVCIRDQPDAKVSMVSGPGSHASVKAVLRIDGSTTRCKDLPRPRVQTLVRNRRCEICFL